MLVSVIIAAYDEERAIDDCLRALLNQRFHGKKDLNCEVIVVANGCTDTTADKARAWIKCFADAGMRLSIVESASAGKSNALNLGDQAASGDVMLYLDADVTCEDRLVFEISEALKTREPRFATGTLTIRPPFSKISRIYGEIWSQISSTNDSTTGCGFYAVNRAGRERWDRFPAIHSDDKFVRLNFLPSERTRVNARYIWPLPEGLSNLIRVRRRWCEGNSELRARYPAFRERESRQNDRNKLISRLIFKKPVGLSVFILIYVSSRVLAYFRPVDQPILWRRGR